LAESDGPVAFPQPRGRARTSRTARQNEGRQALGHFLRLSPRDPARPIRLSQIAR